MSSRATTLGQTTLWRRARCPRALDARGLRAQDQPAGRAELQHVVDVHAAAAQGERLARSGLLLQLQAPGRDHRAVAPKFVLVVVHRRFPLCDELSYSPLTRKRRPSYRPT